MRDEDYTRIFPDAIQVAPGVYEVNIANYGPTWVGGHRALRSYLDKEGIQGAVPHHIVQDADKMYYPSGMDYHTAPCIVIAKEDHPQWHNFFEGKSGMRDFPPYHYSQSGSYTDALAKYDEYDFMLGMPQLSQVAQTVINTYCAENGLSSSSSQPSFGSVIAEVGSSAQSASTMTTYSSNNRSGQ